MRTGERWVRSRRIAAAGLLAGVLALLATPAGASAGSTELVSVSSAGNQGSGYWPALSADGRVVVFVSGAGNLVPGDTNDVPDVFVHDRQTGATERVSVDSAGNQGDRESGYSSSIAKPLLSADGRFVAFASLATNLVPGDTNGYYDVFVSRAQRRWPLRGLRVRRHQPRHRGLQRG
jgi:Tol biopolymer transport system component